MRNEQIKIQVEGSGKDVCLETYKIKRKDSRTERAFRCL